MASTAYWRKITSRQPVGAMHTDDARPSDHSTDCIPHTTSLLDPFPLVFLSKAKALYTAHQKLGLDFKVST